MRAAAASIYSILARRPFVVIIESFKDTCMLETPKVGDRVSTWFSGCPDGLSTVLHVEPYRGKYPQFFTHVLRVSAPNTVRGWMEMCIPA